MSARMLIPACGPSLAAPFQPAAELLLPERSGASSSATARAIPSGSTLLYLRPCRAQPPLAPRRAHPDLHRPVVRGRDHMDGGPHQRSLDHPSRLQRLGQLRDARSSCMRDHSPMYPDGAYCVCSPPTDSSTPSIGLIGTCEQELAGEQGAIQRARAEDRLRHQTGCATPVRRAARTCPRTRSTARSPSPPDASRRSSEHPGRPSTGAGRRPGSGCRGSSCAGPNRICSSGTRSPIVMRVPRGRVGDGRRHAPVEAAARGLEGAGERRAEHHRIGSGGDGLGDVAAGLHAAIGDDRDVATGVGDRIDRGPPPPPAWR